MIITLLCSIELSRNDFLIKILAEITVALHTPRIMVQPEVALEDVISDLERDIGNGLAPS